MLCDEAQRRVTCLAQLPRDCDILRYRPRLNWIFQGYVVPHEGRYDTSGGRAQIAQFTERGGAGYSVSRSHECLRINTLFASLVRT